MGDLSTISQTTTPKPALDGSADRPSGRRFLFLDFPEQLNHWQRWLPYALLLSVTFALYGTTFYFDFVWDDFGYVVNNYRIQALDWIHVKAFWTSTFLGHYAPVHHTFFAILYRLSGMNPFGFHVGQVLVHAGCVCLLYRLVKKVESARVALVVSLLFAIHPANIETVAWISESKSTLAFFFFLLSFWFFIRLRERGHWADGFLSGLFFLLSVLAKINTIVAPAIFLLYDYKQGTTLKNLKWRSLACFFLMSGLFTIVHLAAFHGSASSMENVYLGGLGTHLMNFPLLLSFYLKMIVYPHPLSAWEMFPAQFQFNWLVALGWLGLLSAAGLLFRCNRDIQFWALWILVFLLPVLQIIPFPVWIADRYLYIPAIGGFAIIAICFFRAADRMGALRSLGLESAMLGAMILLSWATVRHLPIWRNGLTLWSATTPTCLTSAYCHMNFGLALLNSGQIDPGMREMVRAVEIRAAPRELERLGDAFTLAVHDYRQAILAYRMAAEKEGESPVSVVYAKLARAHYRANEMDEAARVIEQGKRLNPTDPNLWIIDGFVMWRRGQWEPARLSLRRALAIGRRFSNSAAFFNDFMYDPAEVGRMLADLRPAPASSPNG